MGGSVVLAKTSELREREVVNILDGRKLGFTSDLEIDPGTGKIIAIVLPAPGRFRWLFGKTGEIVIPWHRIKKIGIDVILVELPEQVGEGSYIDLS
ncbi:MAG TPA: YlmC/YmxH family sporulation protein [Firmicutes bacterium]|nr:YlmC/YmxH family sporulation protein [Bacillota bacterium]HBK67164.1 YlmC/YmxH family sporulation protein [Bacillota bacterium]HBT17043.1 YlmC/YmxH family sporulation protein [Bacillota bacterium]